MSEAARLLLDSFDSLAAPDQHEVVTALLHRMTQTGPIPDEAYSGTADQLFHLYDEEEANAPGA